MLSDDELLKAYTVGLGGVPGLRAVAEASAKQALEDAADSIYGEWSGGTGVQGLIRSEAEDWLRARAVSFSADKAGASE